MIRRIFVAPFALGLVASSAGCIQPITPVFTSTEPRIWVVRGAAEVYRCVDMAPEGKGPQPVCVQADRVTKGD